MGLLDEITERLTALPEGDLANLGEQIKAFRKEEGLLWVPNPGPQTDAYLSTADLLLYGGEAGGGKSSLLLGLALTAHKRSLLMRREFGDLRALIDDALQINGTRSGFNGSAPPKLAGVNGRYIDFGACQHLGDEQAWQGQPHDLIGFDEGAHFLEMQVRFLMGWNRSVAPGQRCRVVIATNPPMSSEGEWLIVMFAPWLDPTHHNPARAGELRWFVSDEAGKDREVDGPEMADVGGRMVRPMSRTFIPASVDDNPFLTGTDYKARLDALPEPYRSALRDGNFMIGRKDDARQIIPTEWIRQAQARWTSKPPTGVPMCALGCDIARGGGDNMVLAPRYDAWFDIPIIIPGIDVPTGKEAAGAIIANRRDDATIIVDMGGGHGGSPWDILKSNGFEEPVLQAYVGSSATGGRTKDGKLGFYNLRTQALWRFRELLDPSQAGGSPAALPDDPELVADLTAPRILGEPTARGIRAESKEDIVARLGRSPDKGDAVMMAWTSGAKMATHGTSWVEQGLGRGRRPPPKVVLGRQAARR